MTPRSWAGLTPFTVGNILNLAVRVAIASLAFFLLWRTASFTVLKAAAPWSSLEACRGTSGACWPFIAAKMTAILFGRYPQDALVRPCLAVALPPCAAIVAVWQRERLRAVGIAGALASVLAVTFWIMAGDSLILKPVATELWGGLTLTLLVSYAGILVSLPFGLLLALGRRSTWTVPRMLSTATIEVWRGVPLVAVLFMAAVMLPLILPEGMSINKLARALMVIAIFASAYMAETLRGGLQSVAPSQYLTAEALGLTYAQSLALIVLPQAFRNALPAIIGNFIGLLKDTTLILVIGLFDLLGMIQLSEADPAWSSPTTALTGYAFAALLYWCLCFGLSRVGRLLERGQIEKRY